MSTRNTFLLAWLSIGMMLGAGRATAATATWNSGSGAWNQTGKWNTGVVPGTTLTGDTANFGASAGTANTITLDNGAGTGFSPILSNLNVNVAGATTQGVIINSGAGGSLTMAANSTIQWNTGPGTGQTNAIGAGIILKGALNLSLTGAAAAPLTISGAISDAGGGFGVTITGPGSVTFQGANTYTGTTTVTSGTLSLNRTGGASLSGDVVVSGGTVNLLQSNQIGSTRSVTVSSGVFNLNASNQTVGGLKVTGGSLTASTGVITSTTAYDIQAGSIGAILAGSVGLNKTGAGTATLSMANTYTGTTTVSAGTLGLASLQGNAIASNAVVSGGTLQLQLSNQIADSKTVSVTGGTFAIGTNSETVGGVQVANGGSIIGSTGVLTSTSAYDMQSGSVSAILGGSVGMNKTTAGTVTLSGANTFTGTTTVTAGTLSLNTTGAPALAGNLSITGGTVELQQSNQVASNRSIAVTGGTLNIGARSNTVAGLQLTNNGTILGTTGVLTSTTTYDVQNGTVSATLGGSVGLTKSSGNTVTLTGANTYTGTTSAAAGTLNLNSSTGPAVAGNVTLTGGNVTLQRSDQINTAKTVAITSGTLELGANSNTVAGLRMTGGTYHSTTGTLTSTTNYDIQGGTASGKLGGTVALNKTGAGAATLSGANSYTGDTTVSAGSLFLNSSAGPAIPGNLVVNGGNVTLQRSSQINTAKTVTLSSGSVNLGANSNTVAGLVMTGGSVLGTTGVLTSTTDFDIRSGTVAAKLGGSIGLSKTGSGEATLTGANTFTGPTAVYDGTLTLGAIGAPAIAGNLVALGGKVVFASNQQMASNKSISIMGGTLDVLGTSTTVAGFSLKQGGVVQGGGGSITSTSAFDLQSGDVGVNLGGTVGANVKSGVVLLTGQNTYTGLTVVSSGANLGLGSNFGPALAGGLTVLTSSTVTLMQNQQTAPTKALVVDGGTLDMDVWSTGVGSFQLKNGGTILGQGSLYSSSIFDLQGGTVKASLAGVGDVMVSSGNVILAGANSYTGTTTINSGILTVQGSIISPGKITVAGGTLAGSGFIQAPVELSDGSINLDSSAIIDGVLSAINGNFLGSGTVSGAVFVSGGTFTVADQAVLTTPSGVKVESGTLVVGGTVAGNVVLTGTGKLNFTGTGNITDTVMISGGLGISGSGSVGTLTLIPKTLLRLGNGATLTVAKGGLNALGNSAILGGTLVTGSNGFQVDTAETLFLGSSLNSSGGLTKTGEGRLVLLGSSTLGGTTRVLDGTLTLDGTLKTTALEIAAGVFFNGSGTLITSLFTNSGVLNPGHSPGVLRINGNFTQSRTGTLVLEVQDNTVYDRVIATGTVRLAGTLAVRDWAGHHFAYGDIVPGFVQANRIEGRFDKVTMPSANLRGRLVNDGQNLSLVAAPVSYTQVAKPGNQMQVARVLDHWIGHETGDVGLVTLALDVQTEPQYATAFNAIGPAYYSVIPQVGIEEANAQQSLMQQRFAEIHSSRSHAYLAHGAPEKRKDPDTGKETALYPYLCMPEEDPWTEWVQLNGLFARFETLQSLANANFDSAGAMAGLDHRIGFESAIGVAVGYNYTHLGFDAGEGSTIDTGRVTLYGSAGLGDGYFLDASVSGGYANYDLKRPVKFSFIDRIAHGRTDGSELSAAVHFSKEFHVKSLSVTPQLGLQYTRIHVNGLNETNAGALNLAVNGYGAESLRGTLGVQVAYNARLSDRATLTPYLTLSWQHEFNSPDQTVRAALPAEGGGEFRYDGGSLGGDRMQAGAGLMLLLDDKFSVNLGYQAEFGSGDYEAHMIMLMVSYRF